MGDENKIEVGGLTKNLTILCLQLVFNFWIWGFRSIHQGWLYSFLKLIGSWMEICVFIGIQGQNLYKSRAFL